MPPLNPNHGIKLALLVLGTRHWLCLLCSMAGGSSDETMSVKGSVSVAEQQQEQQRQAAAAAAPSLVCVECGRPVALLFREYNKGNIRLGRCVSVCDNNCCVQLFCGIGSRETSCRRDLLGLLSKCGGGRIGSPFADSKLARYSTAVDRYKGRGYF